jgi:imidazolonepropionase-like amidohydrolase
VVRTVLTADRLIDGCGGEPVRDAAVVLEGERIAWAGTAASMPEQYRGRATIRPHPDCTVLPGFIDAHAHFTLFADGRSYEQMAAEPDEMMLLAGARNAWRHLSGGVTTARDNGSRGTNGFLLRQAISSGIVPGPRLLAAGPPITPPHGHFHWCGGTASGEDAMSRQVRKLAALGADHIKIMASGGDTAGTDPRRASYSAAEIRAAVSAAHDLGILTTAHCRASESMQQAAEAGVDCIEHAEFLGPDGVMRFDEVTAAHLAQHGTYLSPTLPAYGWDAVLRHRKIGATRELAPEETCALRAAEREISSRLEQIGKLLSMGLGGQIIASTDAGCFDFSFGHIDYAMHLMVAAGMTEMEAIMATTSIAARACGVGAEVGTVQPGKTADIVIIRGDPLTSIDHTADTVAVYHRGALVSDQLTGSQDNPDVSW